VALDDLPRSGHPRSYGPAERARIEQALLHSPELKEDGTATWSLTTLQRSLREAPDGLPKVSTFTILHTIHEAGYTWQKNRTWCKTGFTLHKTKDGVEERYDPYTQEKKTVIERAYVRASRLGLELWCQDEGGQDLAIPQPGSSFQPQGDPARRPHEYVRGGTAKLLTLFRPSTGEVRAEAVEQSTNAILHPWLKRELTAILEQCPPPPEAVPIGRRWQDWYIYSATQQLDRLLPPVRVLLIWDNLAGHKSHSIVQWCAEHGILLLSTQSVRLLAQHGRVGSAYHQGACTVRSASDFRSGTQASTHRCRRGLESSSNAVYLGRQATCSSRPGLCSTPPSGRIWCYYDLCPSSACSLRSLLPQSRLMPLLLATDPLVLSHGYFSVRLV
jgi:hypothetical protein